LSGPAQITVLVPVREYRPDYLQEAVDSVLAQSSDAWRMLIVADGPEPSEIEAVLAPRCHDARIEVIRNDGRQLAGALNTGMRKATTPFVAVLLGDDTWEPAAISVLTRAIEANPEVDFFHSAWRVVDEDGSPISEVYPADPGICLDSFGPWSPAHHLFCWRAAKALDIGGLDESLNSIGADDFDFPWSMAEHGAVFGDIQECLYVIRDHRSHFRLTTHVPRSVHLREIRRIMRKHGMGRLEIERSVRKARRSYLRQCLYRSRMDRWLKERLRLGRVRPWYETW
jgi:glycosyltransferase involved in cell wall biosynthesis